ncbi:MAG: glycosyltransferase [Clostridiales bacterium]|jgi:glycosyltransferase involved in cell wall biosynthesis|nr:glycosyltransferase [Clostridiales bacterium]
MGIEISLCMIVKNEEENLGACLDSVRGVADEIIIVDTGSTDGTLDIAARYTDKIYHFDWIDDFAAARNYSFSKGTKEYLMWLDADDTITEENRLNLIQTKALFPPDVDYVVMYYYTQVDEEGQPIFMSRRERILRRAAGFQWQGALHEYIPVSGKGYRSRMYVTHNRKEYDSNTKRNMSIIQKKADSGELDERDAYYYAGMLYADGRKEEALEQARRYLSIDTLPLCDGQKIYFLAHDLMMERGDHEGALKALTEKEKFLKDKSEYYCQLGFFYRDIYNDKDKACEYFRQALQCEESMSMAGVSVEAAHDYYYFIPYAALGQCQIALRQYRDAYDSFRMALSYKPEDEETQEMARKLDRALTLRRAAESMA